MSESVVEEAALEWCAELGYSVANFPNLASEPPGLEQPTFNDVALHGRLRQAIARLNPTIPIEAQGEALRNPLCQTSPSLMENNRKFYIALRDGVAVEMRGEDRSLSGMPLRIINFENLDNNHWLAINQFIVSEGLHHVLR